MISVRVRGPAGTTQVLSFPADTTTFSEVKETIKQCFGLSCESEDRGEGTGFSLMTVGGNRLSMLI
jgi:hypothetical protein